MQNNIKATAAARPPFLNWTFQNCQILTLYMVSFPAVVNCRQLFSFLYRRHPLNWNNTLRNLQYSCSLKQPIKSTSFRMSESFENTVVDEVDRTQDVKLEAELKDQNLEPALPNLKTSNDQDVTIKQEMTNVKTEESVTVGEGEEKNPYAYLDRDEFTSEKFKIEVKGLPKFFGFKEVKKLLNNKLNLNAHKIKAGKSIGSGYMFVSFKTEDDKQHALKALNGYQWKNKLLSAEVAKGVEDPLIRKRAFENIDKGTSGFRQTDESIEDTMQRVTIPWYTIPYSEQLQRKMTSTNALASEMTKKILEVNSKLREQRNVSKLCPIEEIKASPVTEYYRNKCEFSIGYHPDTNEKMVGFRASSYKAGSVAIGPISHLVHLPKSMVNVATVFQDYIRSSNIQPFDPESHEGYWKTLTVRTTTIGEVMIIVLISAKVKELKPEEFTEMKNSIVETFSSMTDPKIVSCFLKTTESHGQQQKNAATKLFGEDYITEELLGLKFRISPDAFFQINVPATEVLYTTIGSLLESNPSTTVLDVCCGTGTIGISMASKCGQVLGIEMIESAVESAKQNALLNCMTDKCEFFAGRAEDIIDIVIARAKFENIVAIVDPPRSGLHQRVILLLRKCEKIKHLIYVSCDARNAMQNFVDLARPISKKYIGAPFFPTKIIPVDMFPHCHQTELVICFERNEVV